MKIIRHTARDMRQALRAVREQLGEDAVILSSRRTGEGVEVTAAVDFDATTLEAGGFSNAPAIPAPSPILDATPVVTPAATRGAPSQARQIAALTAPRPAAAAPSPARPATAVSQSRTPAAVNPTVLALTTPRAARAIPATAAVAPAPEPALS